MSTAAALLLGGGAEVAGHAWEEFVTSGAGVSFADRWNAFLEAGDLSGELQFTGPDGRPKNCSYYIKPCILPGIHACVLSSPVPSSVGKTLQEDGIEFALDLLDETGCVVSWYRGAERLYGYKTEEVVGRSASMLHGDEYGSAHSDQLERANAEGFCTAEGWHIKKDGHRFWANVISLAVQDHKGHLCGFARITRDFSGRHGRATFPAGGPRTLSLSVQANIAGMFSGESDRIVEANDAFLGLVGYTRRDLMDGRLNWPALRPPECVVVDEVAYEEALRFRACTPFEREFIRKDGTRVLLLVTATFLSLLPFRWVTFVQELNGTDEEECVVAPEPLSDRVVEGMIGSSDVMKRLMSLVEVVAPTPATVLVLGETGTGKELIARAIHKLSDRAEGPFVSLNCAAIPTGLLESELFGYERGAFTGALSQKVGRFEMANHGTLFLDEVGDIPLELQPKLLRALQEKSYERLGGTRTIPIDVRLIAATNRNLDQMMEDRLFRADLYYRLRVFPINTPRLRDHADDIPALTWHFVKKYAASIGRIVHTVPLETMRSLMAWSWPGNVRELENFIERSVILTRGPTLHAPLAELRLTSDETMSGLTLKEVEREHILRMLRESKGVISVAAKRLSLQRTTLNAIMKRLEISRADI